MRKFVSLTEIKNCFHRTFEGVERHDPYKEGAERLIQEIQNYWKNKFDERFRRTEFEFLMQQLDKPVAVLSFGEGEISFIVKHSSNHPREIYTPEAENGLIRALKLAKRKDVYITTILGGSADRICDTEENVEFMKILNSYGGEKEELNNAKLFYELVDACYNKKDDDLTLEFLKLLKNKKICLIGGKHLEKVKEYFDNVVIVETPTLGATCWMDRIKEDLLKVEADIFLFSCGITGNILIADTFDIIKKPMIDVGSFWDLLLGIGTRREDCYNPPLIKPNQI